MIGIGPGGFCPGAGRVVGAARGDLRRTEFAAAASARVDFAAEVALDSPRARRRKRTTTARAGTTGSDAWWPPEIRDHAAEKVCCRCKFFMFARRCVAISSA